MSRRPNSAVKKPIGPAMQEVLAVSLLGFAILVIYLQVASHRPIPFDDSLYLTGNAWVLRGLTWEGVVWAFTNVDAANWHPITWISHMVDQQVFGSTTGGHMVENLFWHIGNSYFVYRLLLALGVTRVLSLGLALVFACHPLNVESVAWLSQRKNQISTFMLLGTVLLYLQWRLTGRRSTLVLLTVAYAVSLMAKAMGVTLPLTLALYEAVVFWRERPDFWQNRDWHALRSSLLAVLRRILPLVGAAVAVAVATFLAQNRLGAVASLESIPIFQRGANALGAFATYRRTFFWPADLCLFYPMQQAANWPAACVGILLGALGTLWAMLQARRAPMVMFGWAWFVISLLPVIGLVQVGSQSHADRYMYVPMIGLLLMLGAYFDVARIESCRASRTAFTTAVFVFAVGMGGHAYAYTMLWRNPETAYRRSLEVGGVSYTMMVNLAATLTNLNYFKSAEMYSEIAAQLWSDRPMVLGNLASLQALLGKFDQAEAGYRRAIEFEPDNVQHYYMLALVLLHKNQNNEAEAVLNQALRLLPSETDWRSSYRMIRSVLLREIPISALKPATMIEAATANPGIQSATR
ncbi:MAG: tetratricopeptide repeat protein [Pirellulaceae bacterium]|nr:tetratricopeptide repeat protein [Pirellulaceae bacterium]